MSSIFLSHNSHDKPFVEKLANDLKRLGIEVWFDKWEIKVGESLTWKIEEGIREHEYLGIVLSPRSLASEWVRNELSAAWIKQINIRKIVVLPILFEECNIPLFLQDRKYANFSKDYRTGLDDLSAVFGIKNSDMISIDNWRKFKINKNSNWQIYRDEEFSRLVSALVIRADSYNWSTWGGRKGTHMICLHAFIDQQCKDSVTIRLDGQTCAYRGSRVDAYNPNHLKATDFNIHIGNSINEVEEFVWRVMEDFRIKYGNPSIKGTHYTYRFVSMEERMSRIKDVINTMNWYKGDIETM